MKGSISTRQRALNRAIQKAGSMRKLAKLCGTSYRQLHMVCQGRLKMKLEVAMTIQLLLGIEATLLRPDLSELIEKYEQSRISRNACAFFA